VTVPAHRTIAKHSYLFAFIRNIRVFRVPIALSGLTRPAKEGTSPSASFICVYSRLNTLFRLKP
jgi:hypothetical protein